MSYPKKTVYLAGPIAGLTHDEATFGWRREFNILMPDHIFCSSPMRGKRFLKDVGVLGTKDVGSDNVLASPAGITTRDYNDVKTCDVMVACYRESNGVMSLGTAVEFGYAHAHQIPIVMVGQPDEVNCNHMMLNRMAGYFVHDLEEAAHIVELMLTPGI